MKFRWSQIAVSGLVLLSAVGLRIADPDLLVDLLLKSFDIYQQIRPR